MKTSATNRRLRLLLTAIRDEKLLPRPDFQRRLVWSNKHKVAFVDTVLNNFPFPEIYVAAGTVDPESGEGTEMLVDGQQRITTLYQYFTTSPELKLPKSLPAYGELSPEQKLTFLEYEVVVRDLGSIPTTEIKEIFQRINSTNYALNAMEIHNSRYEGPLKQFAEEISGLPFFEKHPIFSPSDVKRMRDLGLILTYVITVISSYFNREDAFEEFLSRYNDEFPLADELRTNTNQLLAFIEECHFPDTARVWKKADFLTLLVELYELLFRSLTSISPSDVRNAVIAFYADVDSAGANAVSETVAQYYKASIQATNDRGNRVIRGEILRNVLLGGKWK